MATQRDIIAYLKCTIDEDNVEFEKIHKMITKTITKVLWKNTLSSINNKNVLCRIQWVNYKGKVIFVKVYNHNLSSLLRLLIPFLKLR